VASTADYQGAKTVALAEAHTGPDGRFTLSISPGGDSRSLRFSYTVRTGEGPAVSATLSLSVRAALTLGISPRTASVGRQIHFSGRLLGGPVPSSGKLVVLEARSPGGRWIKFNVVSTGRRGRYRAAYRFRFPGPATYQFRVLSEREADYPYGQGASRIVSVYEA
jgi:hypothetical protein